ncbi:MAG TPA: tRNA (adenosine(37)-N6)-threonylcarbamoyltransferase complex dimerization subunit type 1 TsaB [Bryobacteraceae bacterium]|nr:tRNA (adenosine(37)-N6)-threonylcarbamoyltransferase complex dimerization subunit type 1 TsaB [Bryobacteraceae bacterium]
MPLTLAVDTTGDYGSIALADENRILEEVLLHKPQGFSHMLFGEIEALLMRQRVSPGGIELFAGAAGPGSFTGVRVGLTAMKGLAEVFGRRVVAVSNLEAVASFSRAPLRAAVIDARRGEFYTTLIDAAGNRLIPESVLPFQRFLTRLPPMPFEWVSADFAAFAPLLAGTPFESLPRTAAPRALAGAIAGIAIARHAAGLSADPAAIEANYVRRSDAEIFWKEA